MDADKIMEQMERDLKKFADSQKGLKTSESWKLDRDIELLKISIRAIINAIRVTDDVRGVGA